MSNDLNIKYLENYLEKRINDEYDRKYRVNICKLYHVSDNKFEIYVRPSHSDTDDSIVGYEILRDILIEDGMLEKEGDKYLNAHIENLKNGVLEDIDDSIRIDVFTIEKLNDYVTLLKMKGGII